MTNNTAYTSPHEIVQMQNNESYASTRCVQEEQTSKGKDTKFVFVEYLYNRSNLSGPQYETVH